MRLQDRATPWAAALALLLMTLTAHCHPIENGTVQIDGSAIRIMGVIDKTVADFFTRTGRGASGSGYGELGQPWRLCHPRLGHGEERLRQVTEDHCADR